MWCHPLNSASLKQNKSRETNTTISYRQWYDVCVEERWSSGKLSPPTWYHAHNIFYEENTSIRAFCNKKSTCDCFLKLTLQKKRNKINTIICFDILRFWVFTDRKNWMWLFYTVACATDVSEYSCSLWAEIWIIIWLKVEKQHVNLDLNFFKSLVFFAFKQFFKSGDSSLKMAFSYMVVYQTLISIL